MSTQPSPGVPSVLRAINDRAALQALLERGPLTRPQIGALIGLSKPTASHLLARLVEAGLAQRDGIREGGPGRAAGLYRINPEVAYVAGLDVTPGRILATVADLAGTVVGESTLPTAHRSGGDAVAHVRTVVTTACEAAGITVPRLRRVVIGIQGAVSPLTGRLAYAAHIRGWHIPELVPTLSAALGVAVQVDNDVNLSALAEQRQGAARGYRDFVLMWAGSGVGMALVLDGRLHAGATGGAGEIAYMPVPGAPTARQVGRQHDHGLQAFAGGPAVQKVMRAHGFSGRTAADAVSQAVRQPEAAQTALREVAVRMATGLASIVSVVDPELVVLTGDVLRAGGEQLRTLVEHELYGMTIPRPPLRLSAVEGNPVLVGALDLALSLTRDEVFSSTF